MKKHSSFYNDLYCSSFNYTTIISLPWMPCASWLDHSLTLILNVVQNRIFCHSTFSTRCCHMADVRNFMGRKCLSSRLTSDYHSPSLSITLVISFLRSDIKLIDLSVFSFSDTFHNFEFLLSIL